MKTAQECNCLRGIEYMQKQHQQHISQPVTPTEKCPLHNGSYCPSKCPYNPPVPPKAEEKHSHPPEQAGQCADCLTAKLITHAPSLKEIEELNITFDVKNLMNAPTVPEIVEKLNECVRRLNKLRK